MKLSALFSALALSILAVAVPAPVPEGNVAEHEPDKPKPGPGPGPVKPPHDCPKPCSEISQECYNDRDCCGGLICGPRIAIWPPVPGKCERIYIDPPVPTYTDEPPEEPTYTFPTPVFPPLETWSVPSPPEETLEPPMTLYPIFTPTAVVG